MAEPVTISISVFEVSVAYVRPDVRLWVDRAGLVQGVFDALSPWNIDVDDIEPITTGKPSEQGVKFRLPAKKVTFFFGPTNCKFTKEAAAWDTAEETILILDTVLTILTKVSGITLGRKNTTLSLHLQPRTMSYKEILRPFLIPEIAALENEPAEAMALVARWKHRRLTLDGSAALANAIFVQLEREFKAAASYDNIKTQLLADEVQLFRILGVEEDLG